MSSSGKPNPRVLLVEGDDDKRIVPELVEASGFTWEQRQGKRVTGHLVEIRPFDGITKLDPPTIKAELQASHLQALGILVDADEDPEARWREIRDRCRRALGEISPDAPPVEPSLLPEQIPSGGFVATTPTGIRFGIWMMPDNLAAGMMETFLARLRPQDNPPLLQHAETSCDAASARGASFAPVHRDKALIHTWLAWQEAPGRQLHQAVKYRLLDPSRPESRPFLDWFVSLYDLGVPPGPLG